MKYKPIHKMNVKNFCYIAQTKVTRGERRTIKMKNKKKERRLLQKIQQISQIFLQFINEKKESCQLINFRKYQEKMKLEKLKSIIERIWNCVIKRNVADNVNCSENT